MFEIAQEHVKSHSQDGLDFVIGLIQDSVCPCYHAPSQHTVMLTYYAPSFTRNRISVLCHRRRLVLMKLVPVLSSPLQSISQACLQAPFSTQPFNSSSRFGLPFTPACTLAGSELDQVDTFLSVLDSMNTRLSPAAREAATIQDQAFRGRQNRKAACPVILSVRSILPPHKAAYLN